MVSKTFPSAAVIQFFRIAAFSTLRKVPGPNLTISTTWLKYSSVSMPLCCATCSAFFSTRLNFCHGLYHSAVATSLALQYSCPPSAVFLICSKSDMKGCMFVTSVIYSHSFLYSIFAP